MDGSYKSALSPTTKGQYRSVAKHVCDYQYHGMRFGDMTVKSFLPIHIAEYMMQLAGTSKSNIGNHRIVLYSLFSTAYDNGIIPLDTTRKFQK